MRSSGPIPDNPWPHDMTLTIEDDSNALIELLWIREAWKLHPVGDDLPPLLSDTSVSAHTESAPLAQVAQWQDAWPALWEACVRHAGLILDGELVEQLHDTVKGSDERTELLKRIVGPNWRDTCGDAAFTDRYQAWTAANFEAHSRRHLRPLVEEPERMSLAALIPAWQAGLSKVVVIPCRGTHTRVTGEHALLVTAETRDDPQRYSDALAQFARPATDLS